MPNIFSPYDWVEGWQRAVALPSVQFAALGALLDDRQFLPPPAAILTQFPPVLAARRAASALFRMARRLAQPHAKPDFGIASIDVDGELRSVSETVVSEAPFCRLLRFEIEGREAAPAVLLIAPMAGHYATLLRATVRDLLPFYRVFITDWANARDVPLSQGGFDLDDYIDQLIGTFADLGPNIHAVAICQAGVPLAAALALMEADEGCHAHLPRSAAIMGAPIDTRCSPTQVNALAGEHEADWFADNLIAIVPSRYAGAHRAVYPGYLQLTAFIAMSPERHQKSARDALHHFAEGDFASGEKIDAFYGEFLSTMDLTAEFYLQTVERVFRQNQLACGTFVSRGRPVDLARIERTPILAVEGERDDITGLGQTRAVLDLATGLPEAAKRYLLLEDAGHYGLFSGSRFRAQVVPALRAFHQHAASGPRVAEPVP